MREMVFACMGFLFGILCGGSAVSICWLVSKNKEQQKRGNRQRYLDLVNQWLIALQSGCCAADFLKKRNIYRVAVYGMGLYGRHFIRELSRQSEVVVVYGIDCKKMKPYRGVCVLQPGEQMEEVDAIINTVIWNHHNIEKQFAARVHGKILNLEDIIFDLIPADQG